MTIAAAIADLIATQAAAWEGGDVEAIGEAMGLPQMVARSDGTVFIEDEAELDSWIGERLAGWEALGVVSVTAEVDTIEPLPDEAARVTTTWRLAGKDGSERLAFTAVDTLACDDGEWYFVVTDLAGEEAALGGRS